MAVKVEDFPAMATRLTRDDLVSGVELLYRGDDVAYVQAKNLITKGQKAGGKYMLPAFVKNDAMPAGGEWVDLPGNTSDTYKIVKVETDRRGKKGNALPDLVHITGSGYSRDVVFQLNELDVLAKFSLKTAPDPETIRLDAKSRADEILAIDQWKKQVVATGW